MIKQLYISKKSNNIDGAVNLLSAFPVLPHIDDLDADMIIDWIRIDSTLAMRLDTIVENVYGDLEYFDLVKHLNRIRNPFALKEGDIIALPNVDKLIDRLEFKEYTFKTVTPKANASTSASIPNSRTANNKSVTVRNGIIKFSK